MITTIGIIGQGFVGSAVYNGMKEYFNILTYDIDPLKFSNTQSLQEIITQSNICFICVPTPMKKDGRCDKSILIKLLNQIDTICSIVNKQIILVIKSTIPPGTTQYLNNQFEKLHIVFNPQFLTQANANDDFKNQNRIIIGGDRPYSTQVKNIYSIAFPGIPIIKTSSTIAQLVKYITNTFLAMKVSFSNQIYQLCQQINQDYDKVIEYATYDERLGKTHWTVPGTDGDLGYGGHCFPKDIAALKNLMDNLNLDTTILTAVIKKNDLVRTDRN